MKGSYKRNHEGDYHCTGEEVKAMLRDASDYGMDGGILDGFTMDDIDLNTLRSYRIEYERHNPDHVWNGKDDKEFLIDYNLTRVRLANMNKDCFKDGVSL